MCLPQNLLMKTWIAIGLLGLLACAYSLERLLSNAGFPLSRGTPGRRRILKATPGCKNCVALGKEEKAMFRAHSDACLPQSQADPKLIDAMLNGELTDDPGLRRHVYCVLLKCKVISKDGKLQKAAVLGKMSNRNDGKNTTKILESCADQSGDTPEDLAWNLFRCGYDKKAVLFEYMPPEASADLENNS